MVQVLFGTQSAVDELKRGGFTDEQAKANVRFVRDALEGGVATKQDVELSAARLDTQMVELRKDMDILRKDMDILRGEMDVLRQQMKTFQTRVLLAIAAATTLLGGLDLFV